MVRVPYNILFFLLYFWSHESTLAPITCKLKVDFSFVVLPSLFLLCLSCPPPPRGWPASDTSANQSLSSWRPLHWLVGTWKVPRTWEPGSAQDFSYCLMDSWPFAARDHFQIMVENLVPRELRTGSPVIMPSESSQLCVSVNGCSHLAGWVSSSLSFFHLFSVTVSTTCEKLEKAKNELQIAYEGFVQKLNQQHQTDLTELENRLKEFYTGECEKLQNIYIEEAEKYKTQLQEQVCTFRTWACAWPLLLLWLLLSDEGLRLMTFSGCPLMNFFII